MSTIEEAKAKLESEGESPRIDVTPVTAAELVGDDTDRPVADAVLPEAAPGESPLPPVDGRKTMWTDERKAAAKERNAKKRAAKAPPLFDDLNKGPTGAMTGTAAPTTRNYYQEFLQMYIPASFMAANFLGQHWGINIRQAEIAPDGKVVTPAGIALSDEQMQYVSAGGEWLKYEQFGPMTGRLAFIVATIAYMAPRFKAEPTPTKLKAGWKWLTEKLGIGKGKK